VEKRIKRDLGTPSLKSKGCTWTRSRKKAYQENRVLAKAGRRGVARGIAAEKKFGKGKRQNRKRRKTILGRPKTDGGEKRKEKKLREQSKKWYLKEEN